MDVIAGATKDPQTSSTLGAQKVLEAETSVGMLLPMPSANVLASIDTNEAFSAVPEVQSGEGAECSPDSFTMASTRESSMTGSEAMLGGLNSFSNSHQGCTESTGPELPLMVCPNNLTFSFCEVRSYHAAPVSGNSITFLQHHQIPSTGRPLRKHFLPLEAASVRIDYLSFASTDEAC